MNNRRVNKLKRIWKRSKTLLSFDRYKQAVEDLTVFLVANDALADFIHEATEFNSVNKWRVIKNHPFRLRSYKVWPMCVCDGMYANRGITHCNAVAKIALEGENAIRHAFQWAGTKKEYEYWNNLSNEWESKYWR